MSLNDPQIQLAQDAAQSLMAGTPAGSLALTQGTVDIRTSLAPWVAVFDASGTPIASAAVLDGAPATLPSGVFDESTWHTYAEMGVPVGLPAHEDRFSWQPRSDVRQAVVLVHVSSPAFTGFVASGRSMSEVETRVSTLTQGAAGLWVLTQLATVVGIWIVSAII